MRKIFIVGCFSLYFLLNFMTQAVAKEPHIQFFGFAAIDCGYDDPTDGTSTITNYISEVSSISNVGHMCVYDPNDATLPSRLALFEQNKVGAILAVQNIFFDTVKTGTAPSGGQNWVLREDYLERWNRLLVASELDKHQSAITAFYLFDEPIWNGLSTKDLKIAANTIEKSFPHKPIALVEAPDVLDALVVPNAVDWVAFNKYAVADPNTDARYRTKFALIESKLTSASQKLLVIMETRWLPFYADFGYEASDMADVAESYFKLAQSNPRVIGIIGWLWPGGFNDEGELGARNMPKDVQNKYREIFSKVKPQAYRPRKTEESKNGAGRED